MDRLARLAAVVPLPAVIATSLFCADTVAAVVGRRFLLPPARLTLADAIALRNTGDVMFQILDGVDPNEPSLLVQASPLGRPRRVLPAEVAIFAGDEDLLALLIQHGLRLDDALLVRLRCEAERLGENGVADRIDARLGRKVDCGQ